MCILRCLLWIVFDSLRSPWGVSGPGVVTWAWWLVGVLCAESGQGPLWDRSVSFESACFGQACLGCGRGTPTPAWVKGVEEMRVSGTQKAAVPDPKEA